MLRLGARRAFAASSVIAATAVTVNGTQDKEKLPIYPIPTEEVVHEHIPTELEKQITIARRRVTSTYRDGYAQVQGVVDRWIGVEHAVENRVKSIISPTEPLTPGILYVGVAALTGSIISRNRFILTRLTLPPTLFIFSLNYFLPQTTHNLSAYLSSLEETYFPTVAEKHAIANAHSRMAWERLKEAAESGKDSVGLGTETALGKVQDLTGLKLRETLGWGKAIVEEKAHESKVPLEVKAHEAKAAAEKKVEELKADGQKKVEEIKKKLV